MWGGVRYTDSDGKLWSIYFPNPKAALPIIRPSGVQWMKWGKHREETLPGFVQGGWARSDSVEMRIWDKYDPEFVLLAPEKFMQKDGDKVSHWFDVPPGKAIQGLVAHVDNEERVYVITESVPVELAWLHDRWPSMVDI